MTQSQQSAQTSMTQSQQSAATESSAQSASSHRRHTPGGTVIENATGGDCVTGWSYDEVVYCQECGAEISRTTITQPPGEHTFGDPYYRWSAEYSICTALHDCYWCAAVEEIETVTAEVEIIEEATCTEYGHKVITAHFTTPGLEDQTEEFGIWPLNHRYGAPEYYWSDGYTVCTAKSVCQNDPSHVLISQSYAQTRYLAPTLEAEGYREYTAYFDSWETPFKTQTVRISIPSQQEGDATYEAEIDGNGVKVTYGLYPQSHVKDPTIIRALNVMADELPSYLADSPSPEPEPEPEEPENVVHYVEATKWYFYEGNYYAAVESANPAYSFYKFADGDAISKGDRYWFRCDPIEWTVLDDYQRTEGSALALFCDKVLDAMPYYDFEADGYGSRESERTLLAEAYRPTYIPPYNVYFNNYGASGIRGFLNGSFLKSALYYGGSRLLYETVSNGPETFVAEGDLDGYWDYCNPCYESNDGVFLPSYADLCDEQYGFPAENQESETRIACASDYAIAKGLDLGREQENKAPYWTRSPKVEGSSKTSARFVDKTGWINAKDVSGISGVRPMIRIRKD